VKRQQKSRNTVKLAAFALGVEYKSCCEKAAEISKYAKRNLLTKPSRRNQLVFCQQVSYGIVMSQ
jgi:menaquinone-dependent protoporphyrinogen IX oxidase